MKKEISVTINKEAASHVLSDSDNAFLKYVEEKLKYNLELTQEERDRLGRILFELSQFEQHEKRIKRLRAGMIAITTLMVLTLLTIILSLFIPSMDQVLSWLFAGFSLSVIVFMVTTKEKLHKKDWKSLSKKKRALWWLLLVWNMVIFGTEIFDIIDLF